MKIGIFGGMFDPVHFGHLRPALETKELAGLDEVRFLPCARPPHRDAPSAPADQRVDLLELAVADVPGFRVDTRELERSGLSYTVDTLQDFRRELPDATLVLMVGEDAFAGFDRWHRWQDIFELSHVIVMRRPGSAQELNPRLDDELMSRACTASALPEGETGRIAIADVTPLAISSTAVRHFVAAGGDTRFLVPDAVAAYLRENPIYT